MSGRGDMSHYSTVNRSEHPSTSSVNTFDLPLLVSQLKSEAIWKEGDRNSMTIYMGDRLRVVLVAMKKGTWIAPHDVDGPISVQLIEGSVEFKTDGAFQLRKGFLLTLQEGVTHEIKAVEEATLLLTMVTGQSHGVEKTDVKS